MRSRAVLPLVDDSLPLQGADWVLFAALVPHRSLLDFEPKWTLISCVTTYRDLTQPLKSYSHTQTDLTVYV